MKKVIIDASSLLLQADRPFLSGIGRTTLELIRTLEARPSLPFRLALFCQRFNRDRLQRYRFKSPQYCLPLPRMNRIESVKNIFPVVETLTRADLYHIPHNYGGFCRGSQTILTIHDAMMFAIREDHLFNSDMKKMQKKAAERCRAILTCSQSSKNLLLKYLEVPEEKIIVAHWGYDTQCFRELPEDVVREQLACRFQIHSPYLFSVSCDIGRKRTPELIRQYLNCAAGDFPYDLVLVWRKVPAEISSLISVHPAGHRIKILSAISNEDLALLYNGSICTVFPATHEGFGLPLLESMACGTPVLTTQETSMPEIAGDAGLYFDSLEEDEIGRQLRNLAEGKFDLKGAVQKSLLQARKFSWERCAKITISTYERCLS